MSTPFKSIITFQQIYQTPLVSLLLSWNIFSVTGARPAVTCSKSTIETPEEFRNYFQT